ncbi:MarR family winged helix-turn-helix transcriptional regulator [Exiguobacterium sp. 22311]|uniref:MarR family winged helix-turn-helix transcriptional regulator n=1 Tax=Exiguobacterium sp. 22311 TaxID=3453907 RepID=UPI003F8791D9
MQDPNELFQTFTRRFGLLNKNCCSSFEQEVTLVQSYIIFEISRHPESPMQEVADAIGMDITTFSRQIQTLIKKGFVLKTPSEHDRRIQLLRLSQSGEKLSESINLEMNTYLDSVFENMSDFEKEIVLRSINLLNSAMLKSDFCCKPLFN